MRLYEKGLIYRGPRLINWSPGLKTAVSDLEVESTEEEVTLYYFKYMLKPETSEVSAGRSSSGAQGTKTSEVYIPVATVRPETILGDTAVAVHPDDERYKKYVGRTALVPILGREIPVIADEYVSREFGTGALKITPGHDQNDYAIAQRHHLPVLSVLDEAARINENGGRYAGQDRFECREKLWADMKRAGLVIKTEPYTTAIPRSQRGGEIVEPMISTQWFVTIEPLAKAAFDAVKDGRIKIVPDHFESVYFNWLANIKDWCISRQLWWGHRIPVWYCPDGHMTTGREDPAQMRNMRLNPTHAGSRCARHLVLFGAVAVLHPGLAGRDAGSQVLLSHVLHGDRLRHIVLLGGTHDHDGPGVHGSGAIPHRLPAWTDPRRTRAQDVQDLRQCDRPADRHGRTWHGCVALHVAGGQRARQRHQPVREEG